jgi:serine/threonine protein phosphatase PrpC
VRELGAEATALYSCLGVSDPGPDGKLIPFVARSLPFITHWKLLPGDVVVLCSDGLVEEGVFLDPVELAGLLISETDRPASELAELLVQAAKLRHRNPTPWEPEGCGDDVTCIVLVVKPG